MHFFISGILHRADLVEIEQLTVVQREDLVGSHIGETADKTAAILKKASGGTLLVDESYRLVPIDSTRDFGPEALDTFMTVLEGGPSTDTNRHDICGLSGPDVTSYSIQSRNGKKSNTHFSLS